MKLSWKLFTIAVLMALVFMPTSAVFAKGVGDGKVIFGGSYTLESGDTLEGDLVVMGGAANIEHDATIEGNVMIMGGSVEINGTVQGDVAIIGGSVSLGASAVVEGNIATIGGNLRREDGAVIEGSVTNSAGPEFNFDLGDFSDLEKGGFVPPVVAPPSIDQTDFSPFKFDYNPLWDVVSAIGWAILLGVLAAVVAALLPTQVSRVGQSLFVQPVATAGMGCLTAILVPIAIVILALLSLTIILIPVTATLIFIVAVVIAAGLIFGQIGIGFELGQRFSRAFNWNWAAPLSAGVGTFLLALLVGILGQLIFCIGGILPTLLSILAIGAVVITRFGTQAVAQPVAPVSGQAYEVVETPASDEPLPPAN